MDAAGLAGKLHGFQTTLTSLIRHLQRPYAFREDDEIELKHFIKNIDRAINNIKDVVEGATGPVQMVDECPIVPGPTSSGDGASVMPADVTPVAPIVIEPKQLSQDTPLHDADMTTTAMESVVISHVQSISEDVKPEQTSAAVAAPHVSPSMEDVTCTHVTPKQDVPQTPTLNTSSTSISPTQNLSFTQNTPGTSFTQDAAGTSVTLECTSIHIGSLKGEAEFRLTLSTSGVDISLTGAMGDRIDFHIGCEELVKIKSHLLDAPRVIFIYTSPECGERIRQLCNMTDTSGTNYDPLSKVDSERRITVMLEPLTDQVIRTVGTVCWRMEDHPEAPCMLHKKIGTQQASNMLGISTPQRSKPEPRRSDIPASTPQCNTEPPQVEAPKEEPKAGRPVRKSAAAASATWKPLVRNRDSTDSNKTVELDDDDLPDIIGETPTRTSPADKDDPDFGDEDFDESVLQLSAKRPRRSERRRNKENDPGNIQLDNQTTRMADEGEGYIHDIPNGDKGKKRKKVPLTSAKRQARKRAKKREEMGEAAFKAANAAESRKSRARLKARGDPRADEKRALSAARSRAKYWRDKAGQVGVEHPKQNERRRNNENDPGNTRLENQSTSIAVKDEEGVHDVPNTNKRKKKVPLTSAQRQARRRAKKREEMGEVAFKAANAAEARESRARLKARGDPRAKEKQALSTARARACLLRAKYRRENEGKV